MFEIQIRKWADEDILFSFLSPNFVQGYLQSLFGKSVITELHGDGKKKNTTLIDNSSGVLDVFALTKFWAFYLDLMYSES